MPARVAETMATTTSAAYLTTHDSGVVPPTAYGFLLGYPVVYTFRDSARSVPFDERRHHPSATYPLCRSGRACASLAPAWKCSGCRGNVRRCPRLRCCQAAACRRVSCPGSSYIGALDPHALQHCQQRVTPAAPCTRAESWMAGARALVQPRAAPIRSGQRSR